MISHDGKTFVTERDVKRLNAQQQVVFDIMNDNLWHTLYELSSQTGFPPQSISARLRDLRKPKFGGFVIENEYVAKGVWRYRLLQKKG